MARRQPEHILIVGAGATGLMAARELGRAGKKVTVLEARDRCGGRIHPLPTAEFGYPADGGAEFVHGEAPVTRGLLREAGLSLLPVQGARWSVARGAFSRDEMPDPHTDRFYERLARLKADITVADFLKQHFAAPEYNQLRHLVVRMVESYDAADPSRASMLALRDEWTNSNRSLQARVVGGYGALIDFLAVDCRGQGARVRLHAAVSAIETTDERAVVHCANGDTHIADAAILTVPLPILNNIMLPPALREKVAVAADIGFGNVIKLLMRFKARWWSSAKGEELSDLLFFYRMRLFRFGGRSARTSTSCSPAGSQVPRRSAWPSSTKINWSKQVSRRSPTSSRSLQRMFPGTSAPNQLTRDLVAARAINWARDPFAGGAYSFATPKTREAQCVLVSSNGGAVLLSGEALYRGREMGTVEAALASGRETARSVLAGDCP